MANVHHAYARLEIKQGMSVTRALTATGVFFASFPNPAVGPNKVIIWLGGNPVKNPVEADIIAKALVEQAVLLGPELYKPEPALHIAQQKLAKIRMTMPYAFAGADAAEPKPASKRASQRGQTASGGDKKEMARVIFDRERGKSNGEIAKIISHEMRITYANAYYYVSRVFS